MNILWVVLLFFDELRVQSCPLFTPLVSTQILGRITPFKIHRVVHQAWHTLSFNIAFIEFLIIVFLNIPIYLYSDYNLRYILKVAILNFTIGSNIIVFLCKKLILNNIIISINK